MKKNKGIRLWAIVVVENGKKSLAIHSDPAAGAYIFETRQAARGVLKVVKTLFPHKGRKFIVRRADVRILP